MLKNIVKVFDMEVLTISEVVDTIDLFILISLVAFFFPIGIYFHSYLRQEWIEFRRKKAPRRWILFCGMFVDVDNNNSLQCIRFDDKRSIRSNDVIVCDERERKIEHLLTPTFDHSYIPLHNQTIEW